MAKLKHITNIDPQTIVGNEDQQERVRDCNPGMSDKMVRVLASGRGPIISPVKPDWPHDSSLSWVMPDWPRDSGSFWVMGFTADGKVCWV